MPAVVGNVETLPVEDRPDPEHMGIYRWTIEQYSSFENKRVIHSPTFEKGGYSWRLWLFPKGSVNATEGDMSIFLHYIKKDDVFSIRPAVHPRAKFSIKINNQLEGEDVQHEIYDFHDFGESNGEWGWKDFAEIDRLFEEDSGLVMEDVLKVELSVFVQPKNRYLWPIDDSEEAKTAVIRVLSDQQMKREIGVMHLMGLPLFEEGKSYCFYEQMRFSNFEKLVSRDLRTDPNDLRFWLCEQLPYGHIRIVKNLTSVKSRLDRVSDLVELKEELMPSVTNSESLQPLNLFVEPPHEEEESVKELNNEEDYIAFCKYYNPWKMELSYVGTVPLRRGCTPAEVIVDARMLAGLNSNADVSLFIEGPPSRAVAQEVRLGDNLEAVGLRPGSTIIIQPRVFIGDSDGKELQHPSVLTFLEGGDRSRCRSPMSESSQASHTRTEPSDDVCVVCFNRPRTVGFLHGDSLHRCVCQGCAQRIIENGKGNCPMCRKKIDQVIRNIF